MAVSKTRELLVDVARQLFAKNGLENTTMNDIAREAGKGRRTLYTYFKSKEEIYYTVIETELRRLFERMNDVAQRDMPPEDKIVLLIFTHLEAVKEIVYRNGNLRAEFFRNIWGVEKVRKNFDRNEQRLFASIMAEGVQQGRFEIDSIPLCADIMHYCIKGLEIPYIYGRLADGMPQGMSRGIVQKLIHKALSRQEKHISQYL